MTTRARTDPDLANRASLALKLLNNGNNWVKGITRTSNGKYCLYGALVAVSPNTITRSLAESALYVSVMSEIRSRETDLVGITTWNDHYGRTWSDIEDVLTSVIQKHTPTEPTNTTNTWFARLRKFWRNKT